MAVHQPLKIMALDSGMVSAFPVTIIPQEQGFTRMLYNFDFDEIAGVVRKRHGVRQLYDPLPAAIKGSYQFLKDGIVPLYITAVGAKVKSASSLGTWSDISPAGWNSATAETCDFASLLGLLVVSDGVNQPFKWDGTTATVLTNMPKAKYIVEFGGRIFAAGISTDSLILRGSDVGDPNLWDPDDITGNALEIYPGGDGAITSITTIEDVILIGKKYSLHMLVGHTVYDFQIIPIDATIGVGSHWTVKHIRGKAYFVSSEGEIFSIEAGTRPERLSGVIQDIIRTVNLDRIDEARAAVMEKYNYVVTLPTGTDGFITLIYDIIGKRWRVSDLNIGSSAVSEEVLGYCFSYPAGKQLFTLDPDTNMDHRDDRTYVIPAYLDTLEYHCGFPEAEKDINNLWLGVWQGDKEYTFYVEAKFDGGEWELLTPLGITVPASSNNYKRIKIPIGRTCYNIQFRIENNGLDDPIRLLDMLISYLPKEVE